MDPADLTPWSPIIAAVITAVAVVAGLVAQSRNAVRAIEQKDESDRRSAHWERIEWAVDLTLQPDADALEVGMAALEALVTDRSLGAADLLVVRTALLTGADRIDRRLAPRDDPVSTSDAGTAAPEPRAPHGQASRVGPDPSAERATLRRAAATSARTLALVDERLRTGDVRDAPAPARTPRAE